MAKNLTYNTYDEVRELYGETERAARANFLLTKIQQKQYKHQYTYQDDFQGVYMSKQELSDSLGQKSYKRLISEFEENRLLTRVLDIIDSHGNELYYFEPCFFTPYQCRVDIPRYYRRATTSFTNYYDRKKKELSKEAKIILSNLRHTKIIITHSEFFRLVHENYPEYLADKISNGKTPLLEADYIEGYTYLWERIIEFNGATGVEYYDFIHEDIFGKRVHTIISQLPKFLKSAHVIEIDGVVCIEADLKQSQPAILSATLSAIKPNNEFTKAFDETNDIYVQLQGKLNLQSRKQAKEALFTMMFGKPFGRLHDVFYNYYPEAGKILRALKLERMSDNPSPKIHSNVAFLMQRQESQIFREVWRSLRKAKIRFVTVHDSVFIPVDRYKEGCSIMLIILNKYLTNPKIH